MDMYTMTTNMVDRPDWKRANKIANLISQKGWLSGSELDAVKDDKATFDPETASTYLPEKDDEDMKFFIGDGETPIKIKAKALLARMIEMAGDKPLVKLYGARHRGMALNMLAAMGIAIDGKVKVKYHASIAEALKHDYASNDGNDVAEGIAYISKLHLVHSAYQDGNIKREAELNKEFVNNKGEGIRNQVQKVWKLLQLSDQVEAQLTKEAEAEGEVVEPGTAWQLVVDALGKTAHKNVKAVLDEVEEGAKFEDAVASMEGDKVNATKIMTGKEIKEQLEKAIKNGGPKLVILALQYIVDDEPTLLRRLILNNKDRNDYTDVEVEAPKAEATEEATA